MQDLGGVEEKRKRQVRISPTCLFVTDCERVADALLGVASALFAVSLAGQRFFRALLFARLQVERMPLDFLDDVFLLHLALKAAQRAF